MARGLGVALIAVGLVGGQVALGAPRVVSAGAAASIPGGSVVTPGQTDNRAPSEAGLLTASLSESGGRSAPASADQAPAGGGPGGTPVRFEANEGQFGPHVEFVARTAAYTLLLTEQGPVFALPGDAPDRQGRVGTEPLAGQSAGGATGAGDSVKLTFGDGGTDPTVEGVGRLPGTTNYLTGPESQHVTDAAAYQRVRYQDVWPGIDVVFYTTEDGEIEYDFEVAPGADPQAIGLTVDGAEELRLTDAGELMIDTAAGPLRQSRPKLHQPTPDGDAEPVDGRFAVDGEQVGFRVGDYDPGRRLVIDPVIYATDVIGGQTIAIDNDGHAYIAYIAHTNAQAATPEEAAQPNHANKEDVVVAKLAPDGSRVVWATFLGGSEEETLEDLEVGPRGRVYVAGSTYSQDFPTTTSAYQPDPSGALPRQSVGTTEAFLAVLAPDGTEFAYATLLGGSEIRTSTPPQDEASIGASLGGGGDDAATGVAVSATDDGGVRVHLAGKTTSPDFPATSGANDRLCGTAGQCDAHQRRLAPTRPKIGYKVERRGDAFVATVDPDEAGEASLVWASYLGGRRADEAHDIAVDPDGQVAVVGETLSPDFPTTQGAHDTQGGCPVQPPRQESEVALQCHQSDGFVAVVAADGSKVDYGTYVGTNPDETVYRRGTSEHYPDELASDRYDDDLLTEVEVDSQGRVHVAGETDNAAAFNTLTTDDVLQPTPLGSESGTKAFVAGFDPGESGTGSLAYATYLPAPNSLTDVTDLAVGPEGVYLTGGTRWEEFPTTDDAVQDSLAGSYDVYVMRLSGDGQTLHWSTYFGGADSDTADSIAVDPTIPGGVLVTGDSGGRAPTCGAYAGDEFVGGFVGRLAPGSPDEDGDCEIEAQTPLSLTHLSPAGATPEGGREVAIHGTGLDRASRVNFGDSAFECGEGAPCRRVSPTELRVTAPPHEPGVVAVTVTGAQETTEPKAFTYGRGAWDPAGDLGIPTHWISTVTQLDDGRVLVTTSRSDGTAAIYDPKDGSWQSAGPMHNPRQSHTATLLESGKVLIAGGFDPDAPHPSGPIVASRGEGMVATAEIYDPTSGEHGTWTETSSMEEPVHGHEAVRLTVGPDAGAVLVVGGCQYAGRCDHGDKVQTPHSELYDPGSGQWELTDGQPSHARVEFPAARLPDGRVLAVSGLERGGSCAGATCPVQQPPAMAPAEIYEPETRRWSKPPEEMNQPRRNHSLAWLDGPLCGPHCGKLMVVGGSGAPDNDVELYDPDPADSQTGTWDGVAQLPEGHDSVGALGLPDGGAVTLGTSTLGTGVAVALYDPTRGVDEQGQWNPGVPPSSNRARGGVVLSAEPDGFLADAEACGQDCGKVLTFTKSRPELFTPPPTVAEVSPAEGSVAGGTQVTLTGTGFTHGLERVSFGEATVSCPSSACQVNSYDQATVRVPPHAGAGGAVPVTVTNQAGASRPEQGPEFAYRGPVAQVDDLQAEPRSADTVELTWSAVPDGTGGVVGAYEIRQADQPITTEADFEKARSLCGAQPCRPKPAPQQVGGQVSVPVEGLNPATTYHYAVRAVDGDRLGAVSNPAQATTPSGDTSDDAEPDGGDENATEDNTDAATATDPAGGATEGGEAADEGGGGSATSPADIPEPAGPACAQAAVPESGFGDITGSVHAGNIACAGWYGLTQGIGDLDGDGQAEYAPGGLVTRDQMATFLARLAGEAGLALPADPRDVFGDDDGSVHENRINQLAALELVKGLEQGRFAPRQPVSRAQMASFLMRLHERATGERPDSLADAFGDDDGSVHETNINALAALGVTQGRGDVDGDGQPDYAPRGPVTRAQMASFLARELDQLIEHGVAYQGGVHVTLPGTETPPGGELAGQLATNKQLVSLLADGCGLSEHQLQVTGDGGFAVSIPAGQPPGECELVLAATTTRQATPEDATQIARYGFTLTVAPAEGGDS